MKLSLRNKIFISFITVMIITSSFSAFIGIKLVGEIIPIIQDKVRLDLNSAREIYNETIREVQNVIRFTAVRFFIKDALLSGDIDTLTERLENIRQSESLDILTIADPQGKVLLRSRNPEERGDSQASNKIIRRVLTEKKVIASTEILSKEELKKEGVELADRAYTRVISTPHSTSNGKDEETSGMLIITAAPVLGDKDEILGVIYGGKLLNHNYSIVDEIRDTIYEREKYYGKDIGAVTIFQKDIRISTNAKTENGNRALGTLVSEDVYKYVFIEGKTWIERAFAVDDWYITAYEPIKNISGESIGILGLGLREGKYKDMQKNAFWIFLGITFFGIILSLVICYFLTNSIMRPINSLVLATQKFASGNLEQKVRPKDLPEEIAVLGEAFNYMVSSIKDREMQLEQRAQEEIMKSERLAMVGQLAAGVAHEINNPLGGILLFSRLLLKKAPSEGLMRDNLERIEKEAKRCQNIVKGLLEFAREREQKVETIQLNDVIEKTLNLFENQALFHNIDIVKQYQPGLTQIYADPVQIEQVFVNIIMNAADAMNGKGILTLITRLAETGDYVEASVIDTGSGMSQDQIERAFDPFFTTKEAGKGTGLGLSISYGIIQEHGGTIKVSSHIGEGSTFTIVLPVIKEKT